MTPYLHHAALNLGVALHALLHGAVPPQATHDPTACADLARGSAWAWFRWGIGWGPRP